MLKILLAISVAFSSVVLLEAEHRIVGGTKAVPGQFPYQISLQLKRGVQRSHICGGTLVDLRHVVTAAHCVQDRRASEFVVWAGGINLTIGGELKEVRKITVHPKWNKITFDSDIAVLELKKAFTSSTYINPIKLARNKTKEGAPCVVSGWGVTSSGQLSNDLLYAGVFIKDHYQCALNYTSAGMDNINDNMICASDFLKDSCQGDSGGPLVYNNTLIGVVSFGVDCALRDFPGIYTDVHRFADWIHKHSFATCNSIRSIQIIAMFIASTLYTLFFR